MGAVVGCEPKIQRVSLNAWLPLWDPHQVGISMAQVQRKGVAKEIMSPEPPDLDTATCWEVDQQAAVPRGPSRLFPVK